MPKKKDATTKRFDEFQELEQQVLGETVPLSFFSLGKNSLPELLGVSKMGEWITPELQAPLRKCKARIAKLSRKHDDGLPLVRTRVEMEVIRDELLEELRDLSTQSAVARDIIEELEVAKKSQPERDSPTR